MVGLGLTAAAYMAETIRAGIQAVPKGQVEAARSLGMSPGRTMLTIVLPQAFRIIIPPLTNELILLVKDSSLVYVLGVTVEQYELTKFSQDFLNSSVNPTPLIVGGLVLPRDHPPAVQPRADARAPLREGPVTAMTSQRPEPTSPAITVEHLYKSFGTTRCSRTSACRSTPARWSASSAPPAPASRPCCAV